jgi:hypothetical protein
LKSQLAVAQEVLATANQEVSVARGVVEALQHEVKALTADRDALAVRNDELLQPSVAATHCGHREGVLTPYDHPFVDASEVNRVVVTPPRETWFATNTIRYRYVWDGLFQPFGGDLLQLPVKDPTWDAGRNRAVPPATFNVRGRALVIRDGPRVILDNRDTGTDPTRHATTLSEIKDLVPTTFHVELDTMVNHGFTPVLRRHRWCYHFTRNGYQDETAWVVAEYPGWIAIYHPTTLVLWSTECVAYSQAPLPFVTITSRQWARTIPDHNHRWMNEAAEKSTVTQRKSTGLITFIRGNLAPGLLLVDLGFLILIDS